MLLMKRFLQGIAVIVLSGTPGCAIYLRPAPPPGAMFVMREPPHMREEILIARPGRDHVWIGGYWHWREPEYLWIPGRWELPPPRMRNWVAGAWHHDRRGWFFIQGHWR